MIPNEASLKKKRDAESIRLTQERISREREENALKKGIEIGERALTVKLKAKGIDFETISEVTGLSVEEIEKL